MTETSLKPIILITDEEAEVRTLAGHASKIRAFVVSNPEAYSESDDAKNAVALGEILHFEGSLPKKIKNPYTVANEGKDLGYLFARGEKEQPFFIPAMNLIYVKSWVDLANYEATRERFLENVEMSKEKLIEEYFGANGENDNHLHTPKKKCGCGANATGLSALVDIALVFAIFFLVGILAITMFRANKSY